MLEKTAGAIKNGQSRDNGNIGHTRHRTNTNKTQNRTRTTQTIKKKSNTNLTTQPGVNQGAPKGQ
jgi:hypothetical protein